LTNSALGNFALVLPLINDSGSLAISASGKILIDVCEFLNALHDD